MNLQQAVTAHTGWKMKVTRYLSSPDGSLQPATIRQDSRCELGKWLYGEGRSFQHLPEYQKLMNDHARLHESASDLIRRTNSGEYLQPETVMGDRSPFGIAARVFVKSLQSLQDRTGLHARTGLHVHPGL
jgi:hypothetical protein